jgi:hypothetical protein
VEWRVYTICTGCCLEHHAAPWKEPLACEDVNGRYARRVSVMEPWRKERLLAAATLISHGNDG